MLPIINSYFITAPWFVSARTILCSTKKDCFTLMIGESPTIESLITMDYIVLMRLDHNCNSIEFVTKLDQCIETPCKTFKTGPSTSYHLQTPIEKSSLRGTKQS